jgi:hypothetical protein
MTHRGNTARKDGFTPPLQRGRREVTVMPGHSGLRPRVSLFFIFE